MTWQEDYLLKYYESRPGWKHHDQQWRELLVRQLGSGASVLDLGAGPTNRSSRFLSEIAEHLAGADVDPVVHTNRWLAESRLITDGRIPYPPEFFDAVVSSWLIEHVTNPRVHLSEVYRVLRPGGVYVFRTPNVLHFISLAARFTPHWVHQRVAPRTSGADPSEVEVYPTFFRMNRRGSCARWLRRCRFDVESLEVVETYPIYGQSSRLLFLALMGYERVVNSSARLEAVRRVMHGVGRKPRSAASPAFGEPVDRPRAASAFPPAPRGARRRAG
jgi:SAM-dependent methyltransferase